MISDICRTCKYLNISCNGKQLYHCDNYIQNIKTINNLDTVTLEEMLKTGNIKNSLNIAELQSFYNQITEELKRRSLSK